MERDELREEVVNLKDILKVLGVRGLIPLHVSTFWEAHFKTLLKHFVVVVAETKGLNVVHSR